MYGQEIREKFGNEANEAGRQEQGPCPQGTATLLKILAEIAAQLSEQNVHLRQIAEKLESAHL